MVSGSKSIACTTTRDNSATLGGHQSAGAQPLFGIQAARALLSTGGTERWVVASWARTQWRARGYLFERAARALRAVPMSLSMTEEVRLITRKEATLTRKPRMKESAKSCGCSPTKLNLPG